MENAHVNNANFKLMSRVQKLDLSGNLLAEYESVRAALRDNGLKTVEQITRCCKYPNATLGGFKWRYTDTLIEKKDDIKW